MTNLTIVSNHQERPILSYRELAPKYQRQAFRTYLGGFSNDPAEVRTYLDSCSFVVYRRHAYNLSDMLAYSPTTDLDVDCFESDTAFSGVGFKLSNDGETAIAFYAYS